MISIIKNSKVQFEFAMSEGPREADACLLLPAERVQGFTAYLSFSKELRGLLELYGKLWFVFDLFGVLLRDLSITKAYFLIQM